MHEKSNGSFDAMDLIVREGVAVRVGFEVNEPVHDIVAGGRS